MDKGLAADIKRGLKISYDYIICFFIFLALATPIISFTSENAANYIRIASFVVFLLLTCIVYVDMRNYGLKESRPQYEINPKPYKGLLYGFIGAIPLIIVQLIIISIKLPEGTEILHRRFYQAFAGPFYWLVCLLGNKAGHYVIAFLSIIIISFIGYYAGHKGIYILETIRIKLGIKPVKRNNN